MTRNMPSPAPTLDDVARAAGVSTATVSRCLSGNGKVTDATRDRVMAVVNALGYTPNFSARALAAKRTFTIGAIVPTLENGFFAHGLQTFQEALNEAGYTLLVSSTAYHPDREAEQIRALVARGADGLLLIGYERADAIYEFLNERQVPYLLSWAHRGDEIHPAVGFDNAAAIKELAEEVLRLGHRQIGILSGLREGNDRASDRVRGVLQAVAEAGLDPGAVRVIETPYSIVNGAQGFETLWNTDARPSVVICVNDVLAAGAQSRAQEMGLDVPADVSITGFDDVELASLVSPQLTTVQIPLGQMGTCAAQELIRMIEGKGPGQSVQLKSRLCLRDSLGSPPGAAHVR